MAAINAVLFLATPHHGTHHAETLNNLLRVSMVYAPQTYITQMEKDGAYLEEVNEQFLHVSRGLEIFSFYETEDTDLGSGFKPVGYSPIFGPPISSLRLLTYSIAAYCDEERICTLLF